MADAAAPVAPATQHDAYATGAAQEVLLRLDASTRQLQTLELLIQREEQQLLAMEQRAAFVADDWSVLQLCRAVFLDARVKGGIADASATSCGDDAAPAPHGGRILSAADRDAVHEALTLFDCRSEFDWQRLPHAKLLAALPRSIFYESDALLGRVFESTGDATPPPNDGDTAATLDGAAKVEQVTAFADALSSSQEELSMLRGLLDHELALHAHLRATLAEVDPTWRAGGSGEGPQHRFRRGGAASASRSAQAPAAGTGNASSRRSVVTADTHRMHAAGDPTLAPVSQTFRLLGIRPAQRGGEGETASAADRWLDALRVAESLRLRCCGMAAGELLADATAQSAATEGQPRPTPGAVPWRAMVEQTDELAFAIRKAAGATNRERKRSVAGPPTAATSDAPASGAAADATPAAGEPQKDHDDVSPDRGGHHDDDDGVLSALTAQLQARDEQIKQLQAEVSSAHVALDAERSRAAAAEDDARAAGARAAVAEEQKQAVDRDLAAALAEVAKLKKEREELAQLLGESKALVAEIQEGQRAAEERHRNELHAKESTIAELQRDVASLETKLKALSILADAAAKWRAKEEELTAAAESAAAANATAQKELAEVQLELSKLQLRAARDQLFAKEAKSRIDSVVGERRDADERTAAQLRKHEDHFQQLRRDSDAQRAAHADEKEEMERQHRQREAELSLERDGALENNEELRAELEGCQGRIAALEAKLAARRRVGAPGSPTSSPRNNNGPRHAASGVFDHYGTQLHMAASVPLAYYSSPARGSSKPGSPRPRNDKSSADAQQPSEPSPETAPAQSSPPRTSADVVLWAGEQGDRAESPSRRIPVAHPAAPIGHFAALDPWQTKQLLQRWYQRDSRY